MEIVLNLCLFELNSVVDFHHTWLVKSFQCLVVCKHVVFGISHKHCLNNTLGQQNTLCGQETSAGDLVAFGSLSCR